MAIGIEMNSVNRKTECNRQHSQTTEYGTKRNVKQKKNIHTRTLEAAVRVARSYMLHCVHCVHYVVVRRIHISRHKAEGSRFSQALGLGSCEVSIIIAVFVVV